MRLFPLHQQRRYILSIYGISILLSSVGTFVSSFSSSSSSSLSTIRDSEPQPPPPPPSSPTLRFPLPPRGYNPCNGFNCDMKTIGEQTLCSLMDAIATNGMLAANYTVFALDDGWQGTTRTPNNTLTWDTNGFPSGLPALVQYGNKYNLTMGLYSCRGPTSCEGYPASGGFETIDASTFVDWGFRYVKSDSCGASEVHGEAYEDYKKMGDALRSYESTVGEPIFFSLCGWWSYYSSFGSITDRTNDFNGTVGDSWRIGTDVPNMFRFLQNIEAAASVANLTGFGRGWPDLDMIGGKWSNVEEQLHLSLIVIVGGSLLLSWDVRDNTVPTLGIEPYLNPELLSIHHDTFASIPLSSLSSSTNAYYYYQRIAGEPLTGTPNQLPVSYPLGTGIDCTLPNAQFIFQGIADGEGNAYGQLQSVGIPNYCIGIWDLWTGACIDPSAVQLIQCNSTAYGCPLTSQSWYMNNVTQNYTVAVGLNPWEITSLSSQPKNNLSSSSSSSSSNGTSTSLHRFSGMPYPGPYLTHDNLVPNGLYIQPSLLTNNSNIPLLPSPLQQNQIWFNNVTAIASNATKGQYLQIPTVLQSNQDNSTTTCLGNLVTTDTNLTNVWVRWLMNMDVAVLFINMNTSPLEVTCDSSCLTYLSTGRIPTNNKNKNTVVTSIWSVRNVWNQTDLPNISTNNGYTTPILPANGGSLFLRLTPVS